MANISEFYGSITFDFRNTEMNAKEIKETVKYISDYFDMDKTEYYTRIYFDEIEDESFEEKIVNAGFDGWGKGSFQTNVEWFLTDKKFLLNIFPKCCGLKIIFEYCDAEPGNNFIVMNAELSLEYNKNIYLFKQINDGKKYKYTKKNFTNIFLGETKNE